MSANTTQNTKKPVYIILGSGGHTAEMCTINQALLESDVGKELYTPVRYIIAKSDNISRAKITATLEQLNIALDESCFIEVPRSREVGQSYISSVWTTILALLWSFWLVWRDQPRLVLCNGPGTCLPFCIAAYVWRLLRRVSPKTKIVFVESFCRVHTLSLSARLLLPFLNTLVVQWPMLAEKYKHKNNVRYFGNLI